jgi:hypothetical protein
VEWKKKEDREIKVRYKKKNDYNNQTVELMLIWQKTYINIIIMNLYVLDIKMIHYDNIYI